MIHLFPPNPRGPAPQPRLDSTRWSALCKAAAAVAVAEGHITEHEACEFCDMDSYELEVWQHVVRDHGLRRMFAGRL